ncbi:hypothetical protein LCGC14_2043220, partial [marine sediment metagenome]
MASQESRAIQHRPAEFDEAEAGQGAG